MIFRIVLFENAFESFPIGLIPIYLPQKCMVQSRLMYLTGFITHAQVFHMASHQLTYSHMLDELYTIIFSVLSAKKSWFHCFPLLIYNTAKTAAKPYFTRKTRIFLNQTLLFRDFFILFLVFIRFISFPHSLQ